MAGKGRAISKRAFEVEVGDFRAIITRQFVRIIQFIVHSRVRKASQIFWWIARKCVTLHSNMQYNEQ